MPDLASIADVTDRSPRALTSAEQTRAAVLLGDASALIRGYTKRTFTAVANDTVRLRPVGTQLRLPQTPVTAVNSVTAIGWAGIPNLLLPAGFWGWDGIDVIEIAPFSSGVWINLPDVELSGDYPDTYEIDYDHGNNTVPDDVIAICAGMVLRTILAPSAVEGMSAERTGQYSYQMAQQVGGGSPGPKVRLTEQDKEELSDAGYGPRKAATVQVRL